MRCGVVILNFNEYHRTETLLSLIKDADEIDYIVVVDNNSPNDSYEHLLKYAGEKISVIKSGRNGGYSFGNNAGARYLISRCHPDIICIANPDTIFDGRLVGRIKELFALNEDYALITGFNLNRDGTNAACPFWQNEGTVLTLYASVLREIFIRPFVNFSKRVLHIRKPGRYERYVESIRQSTKPLNEVWAVLGCLFFVRTEDFVKAGMFDENIFMYGEENILAFKLHKLGRKTGVANEVTFIHDHKDPENDTPARKLERGMKFLRLSELSAVYYFDRYITGSVILRLIYRALMRLRYIKSGAASGMKKFVLKLKHRQA